MTDCARTLVVVASRAACAQPRATTPHVHLAETPPPVHTIEQRDGLVFSPWDGVYIPERREAKMMSVRTRASGVSMSLASDLQATTSTRTPDGGWRFDLTVDNERSSLTLTPGEPWRAVFRPPDMVFTQHIEPLEARVRARLTVGARFTRIEQDKHLTHDTITFFEHAITRSEMPDSPRSGSCFIDVLGIALDRHGAPLPAPLPKEGSLGVVNMTLYQLGQGCPEPRGDPEISGQDGRLVILADREGRVVGVAIISYMYAEPFIAADVAQRELDTILHAIYEQMGSVAE